MIVDGKARLPIILIECKRSNVALNDNHLRQLNEYLNWVNESKMGILTKKAEHFRRSALFTFGVKDGVRTRDLRNHNPAL